MKFEHSVVYNGKFYRAGEEVPIPVKEEIKRAVEKKSDARTEDEKEEGNTAKVRKKAVKSKEEASN